MQFAHEIATSQVVWTILCIILAVAVIREMRKENVKREEDLVDLYEEQKTEAKENFDEYRAESKEREEKLMGHLERSNVSQEKTTAALQSINRTLNTPEGRVDRIEKLNYSKAKKNEHKGDEG